MCDSLTMSKTRTNKKPASISSRRSERQNTKNCPLAEMSPYSPPAMICLCDDMIMFKRKDDDENKAESLVCKYQGHD